MIGVLFYLLCVAGCAVISTRTAFVTHPLQYAIKSCLGLLALLIAGTKIPPFESTLNWRWQPVASFALEIQGKVTTITPDYYWPVAFGSVCLLLAICLLRVPER